MSNGPLTPSTPPTPPTPFPKPHRAPYEAPEGWRSWLDFMRYGSGDLDPVQA
jgi:hypothetical protein